MPSRAARSNATSAPSGGEQSPAKSYYAWAVCGLLLLAIGLIYGQTLGHIFLAYDDSTFVSETPMSRRG